MNLRLIILKKDSKLFHAIILTVIFTLSLIVLFGLIWHGINRLLLNTISPNPLWLFQDRILNELRPIGYIAFAVTVILIIIGFLLHKQKLLRMGAFGVYLPIFAYYSSSMFFLAGIGIFWLMWIPLFDLSPDLLRLGEIIVLPPMPVSIILDLLFSSLYVPNAGWVLVSGIIQVVGLVIFVFSLITWFYGKFSGVKLIDFWIYSYSRHPQYLGFLVWSYGFFLQTIVSRFTDLDILPIPSFPWLLTATIIIGLALYEDKHLRKNGDWYNETPFMLPLPKKLLAVFLFPTKKVLNKVLPETNREIFAVLFLYNLFVILLSIPLIILFPIQWTPFTHVHS